MIIRLITNKGSVLIMDEIFMELALKLAEKGVGSVNPNPLVGAVIVKNNRIIGMGYHEKYGENHAERNAVKNAVEDVSGSTLYVTLEPCTHYGKTPPCVDLVIEKKFKKVVIGMLDPNPLVAGRSVDKLRKNKIEVIVGVKEEECKRINEVFLKYITSKIPFVVLKSGMSLDGKIATAGGESKWITSEKSRNDGHKLRNRYMGILTGINTIISDNPKLTCRVNEKNNNDELIRYIKKNNLEYNEKLNFDFKDNEVRNPIRIVVDSHLSIPLDSNVISDGGHTIIGTIKGSNKEKKKVLENLGIEIIETESFEGKVNLKELIEKLGQKGIDSILIEGGGNINFSALKDRLIDKVRFYIAPKIIGGDKAKGSISGEGFLKLEDAVNLKDISYERKSDDFIVTGYIDK